MKWILYIALLVMLVTPATGATFAVKNVSWEPYFFQEREVIKGHAKNMVALIMEDVGASAHYQVSPSWQRTLEDGLSKPNTIIAGIGRTQKREMLFYWIGPVNFPVEINLYSLSSNDAVIANIDQLRHYATAVEKHMYYHDFMMEQGLQDYTLAVVDIKSMMKLLVSGKADFILLEQARMEVELAGLGYDSSILVNKGTAFVAQTFLSLSKNTDKRWYKKLKASYEKLAKQGFIQPR